MSKQTHSFQAEVKQILHLVTHSLYSNKEIFPRLRPVLKQPT